MDSTFSGCSGPGGPGGPGGNPFELGKSKARIIKDRMDFRDFGRLGLRAIQLSVSASHRVDSTLLKIDSGAIWEAACHCMSANYGT